MLRGRGRNVRRVGRIRSVDVWRSGPRLGASRGRVELLHDFLARAVSHEFRFGVAQIHGLTEQLHGFPQRSRRFGFHQRAKFGGSFVHGICAEAQRHSFVRTQRVDGGGKRRHNAVHRRLLDKQRLAAAGRFHLAVGEFGDFQFGGDGLRDAFEFAGTVERFEELAEGIKSHASRLAARGRGAMRHAGSKRRMRTKFQAMPARRPDLSHWRQAHRAANNTSPAPRLARS